MAAVLALVMVPMFLAFALFFGMTGNTPSLSAGAGMVTFVVLGTGMLLGLIKFVRGLEP